MIRIVTVFALAFGLALPAAAEGLNTPQERQGYAIGYNMGNSFKKQGMELDVEAVLKGVKEGFGGEKPALTREEIAQAMQTLQQGLMARRDRALSAIVAQNKEIGQAFLTENAKVPGVTTTASGLQYKVIKAGPGVGGSPKPGDMVTVHYQGTLVDGKVFDSSIKRGEPATMKLANLVPGWIEALPMMKKGDKWRIALPSNLGYGDRPRGPIPPASVLIFELELIDFKS